MEDALRRRVVGQDEVFLQLVMLYVYRVRDCRLQSARRFFLVFGAHRCWQGTFTFRRWNTVDDLYIFSRRSCRRL